MNSFRDRLRMRRRLVLFICTGNTCRSPMAAVYMRRLLEERNIREVEVRSAGVMTITGLLASQEAVQVMDEAGVDLKRHRSTQLTPELIHKADLILAMSPFHRQTALRMSDEAKNKTYLLKEFSRSDLKNVQIADPMGCTLEVFKKCFKEIKAACDKFIDHEYVTGRPAAPKTAVRAAAKPVKKTGRTPAESRNRGAAPAAPAAKKASTNGHAKAPAKAPVKAAAATKAKPAAAKATAKPAAKPAAKQATKPVAKHAVKHAAKPMAKPVAKAAHGGSHGKPVAKAAQGNSHGKPVAKSAKTPARAARK